MKRLLKLLAPEMVPLLQDLFERDNFSTEERRKLIQQALLADAKVYVDSIHMILCNSDECDYELEESIEHTWTLPAHVEWTSIAAVIMDTINFNLADWPGLASDYIKLLEIANKSVAHERLLLSLCKNPGEFLDEIRGIISKNGPIDL